MKYKKDPANKLKIFNDPVYGFIKIPNELIFDLIEHPYFQRLRRIKQLGLTHLVYPGALHTRFHHAIGAMHLTDQAIEVLRYKGFEITDDEALGVIIAVLLHDIGHGPFSHALERSIVENISHETLSERYMDKLNHEFSGELQIGLDIFRNKYPKKFLHQMVAGQLDMDRLDYLNRDSYFTGVSEGVISYDRIIKMLYIANDNLVVEEKGIYSIEKFLVARRLMYWQVYLHKTVISAEKLLINILKRAKYLALNDKDTTAPSYLLPFLKNSYDKQDFYSNSSLLDNFARLDDFDFYTAFKTWTESKDPVISTLCNNLLNRHLYQIELQTQPFSKSYIEQIKDLTISTLKIKKSELEYFVNVDITENHAYDNKIDNIFILGKDGLLTDIAQASDQLNIRVLSTPVKKHYICYPKAINSYIKKY